MKMKSRRRIQRDRERRDPRSRLRDASSRDEQAEPDGVDLAVERRLLGYDE